jgi:transcriptional regulator with XRE-family HTH domain
VFSRGDKEFSTARIIGNYPENVDKLIELFNLNEGISMMREAMTNESNGAQEAIAITTVGKRLKSWRKHSMLKLVELSKKIRVSQGSLSDLENDKSLPSATTLANLCMFADINIYWLLTGRGPMTRQDPENGGDINFQNEYSDMMQDRVLKELIEKVIRVYRQGDVGKRAHLEGFLVGADPDNS